MNLPSNIRIISFARRHFHVVKSINVSAPKARVTSTEGSFSRIISRRSAVPTLNACLSSADVLEERLWLSVTRKKVKQCNPVKKIFQAHYKLTFLASQLPNQSSSSHLLIRRRLVSAQMPNDTFRGDHRSLQLGCLFFPSNE